MDCPRDATCDRAMAPSHNCRRIACATVWLAFLIGAMREFLYFRPEQPSSQNKKGLRRRGHRRVRRGTTPAYRRPYALDDGDDSPVLPVRAIRKIRKNGRSSMLLGAEALPRANLRSRI